MEEIKIAAAVTLHIESGITGEIMDSEVDSFTLKFSSVEEIVATECEGPKVLYSDSQIAGEDTLDSISVKSTLGKESDCMKLTSGRGELCPLTPSPDGETVEISSASDQTDDLEALSDCETPTESLFNPFAPGPEKFALAPAPKKKMPREYKLPTRRQLNFDSYSDSEEKLKEICGEDVVEEDNSSDDTSDCFKTPTSIPLLTGIAETCPDAPKRPSFKSRKLDQTICRKLEFESIWI